MVLRALQWARGCLSFLARCGFYPLCRLAVSAVPPRMLSTRILAAQSRLAAPSTRTATLEQLAHGVDCSCYFTDNIFVRSPIEGHFDFKGLDQFRQSYAELLSTLSPRAQDELIGRIRADVAHRRSAAANAAARRRRISAEYVPLHPELWTLREEHLDPAFVALVRHGGRDGALALPSVSAGVYALRVFTPRFCQLLCEELAHFAKSGLPMGRPNSMNNAGVLLGELGLYERLLDPLLREWLAPLCARLWDQGASLDHHKSFVVRYQLGEDEQLAMHFDNAEVTLNISLGNGFDGGELAFFAHQGAAPTCHEWGEVGSGVLHLGERLHAALPITDGERLNLVIWMRSSRWRRANGCPMCDRTDGLLEVGVD